MKRQVERWDGWRVLASLDPDRLLYMYVRKEAVLSSAIEGTQSTLSDLLRFEAEAAPGTPVDDVREVSRYVDALQHGIGRIQSGKLSLSLRLLREIHKVLMKGGRGGAQAPGKFRRTQNWIGGTRPANAKYVPPPPHEMLAVLDNLEQPAREVSLQSAPGEATALGLRAGGPVASHWRWDAGLVWSRNRSALGTVGPSAPDFETNTLFISGTAQAELTQRDARLGLRVGAGPALILHRGSGSSLLTRQGDLGAVLGVSGQYSLDGRLALRLDAQEYLFSSSFREPYSGQFVGAPVQPAGSQFRHEFVLLAGLSWRTH